MTRRILALIAIGLVGGFLSGLFGIGGGVLMVPLLILVLKVDQRHASAMSLLAVLPAAIVGAITYGFEGHVDLIAAALIAAGGIVGALIGTRLLRKLSLAWLRWLFIAFLLLMAIRMLIEMPEGTTRFEFTPIVVAGLLGLGVIVGIASGLFGIGGGVIFVPRTHGHLRRDRAGGQGHVAAGDDSDGDDRLDLPTCGPGSCGYRMAWRWASARPLPPTPAQWSRMRFRLGSRTSCLRCWC